MEANIFGSLLYGLISGLSSFLPISTLAHQYLFSYLFGFSPAADFIEMMVALGCLAAVVICCGSRLIHMRQELRLAALPKRRRKRMPDMQAVFEFRLILIGLIPMILSFFLREYAQQIFGNLTFLCCTLIITGILCYIPQFIMGGFKDSRSLTPLDGLLLGLCSGLSVIPGISGLANVMLAGRMKGCSRAYMLEVALFFTIPMLLGWTLIGFVGVCLAGGQVLTISVLIAGILAGLVAFGGGLAAIHLMRYLAVNLDFQCFSYYCWGLAVFSLIYYLIT